jgi:hypothetical protein
MADTESGTTSSGTQQHFSTQTRLCVKCQYIFDHWHLRLYKNNERQPYHTWFVEMQFHTLPQLFRSADSCTCCFFLARGLNQLWDTGAISESRLEDITGRVRVEYYRHRKHICRMWVYYKSKSVGHSGIQFPWTTLELRDSSGNT